MIMIHDWDERGGPPVPGRPRPPGREGEPTDENYLGVIPFSTFANFTKLEIRSHKSVCLTPKISNKAIIQQYKHQQPQISGFNTTNKGKEKQQPKQLGVEPGIREVWWWPAGVRLPWWKLTRNSEVNTLWSDRLRFFNVWSVILYDFPGCKVCAKLRGNLKPNWYIIDWVKHAHMHIHLHIQI